MDRATIVEDHRQRKVAAAAARVQRFGRERTLNIANQFDRTGIAAASCDLIDTVVTILIDLCFAYDPEVGRHENIDGVTGQLLFPVPWGKRYSDWSLRASEAEILRRHMMALQRGKPLFLYDASTRRWHITANYPKRSQADEYWTNRKLTASQFLKHAEAMRKRRRDTSA